MLEELRLNLTNEDKKLLLLAVREAITAYTFTLPRLPRLVNDSVITECSDMAMKMRDMGNRLISSMDEDLQCSAKYPEPAPETE